MEERGTQSSPEFFTALFSHHMAELQQSSALRGTAFVNEFFIIMANSVNASNWSEPEKMSICYLPALFHDYFFSGTPVMFYCSSAGF